MTIKRISSVSLSDLGTVRVTCHKCGKAVETKLDEASDVWLRGCCRFCDAVFTAPNDDKLQALANAIKAIIRPGNEFSIDFPINDFKGNPE